MLQGREILSGILQSHKNMLTLISKLYALLKIRSSSSAIEL